MVFFPSKDVLSTHDNKYTMKISKIKIIKIYHKCSIDPVQIRRDLLGILVGNATFTGSIVSKYGMQKFVLDFV